MIAKKHETIAEDKKPEIIKNVLQIDRVTRVQAGGRRFRFRALVVVGDGHGSVGVGVAKGKEVSTAISKATDKAMKKKINIDISKGTIKHEIKHKKGSAIVMLRPAKKGTGVIAGGAVRAVLEVVGIKDCVAKILGSNNKINNANATIEALTITESR